MLTKDDLATLAGLAAQLRILEQRQQQVLQQQQETQETLATIQGQLEWLIEAQDTEVGLAPARELTYAAE